MYPYTKKDLEIPSYNRYTFLFAMPFSGSTFVMRLAAYHNHYGVKGDSDIETYKGLVSFWESYQRVAQYGNVDLMCERGEKPSRFVNSRQDNDKMLCEYSMKNLIYRNGMSGHGFCKATNIGYDNNLVGSVAEMIRSIHESNPHTANLTIGFLTRDVDEIITEMKKRYTDVYEEGIRPRLESQLEQFREAFELGDVMIKHADLMADPLSVMKKLKVHKIPTQEFIDYEIKRNEKVI